MILSLTILGDVPSKKNSKRRIQRGKRIFMVPSEAHEAWHTETCIAVKKILRNVGHALPPIEKCREVAIRLFSKTAQKSDLTNKAESIMDLLVDVGVLSDDNWNVVPRVVLLYGGKDAKRPRAEVIIS